MRRLGIVLAASYDTAPPCWREEPARWREEVVSLDPDLVVLPMKQAHAGRWRLVRDLLVLPNPPVLVALADLDVPAFRQSALDHGVNHVFDPLLELDAFLGTLRQIADSRRQFAS